MFVAHAVPNAIQIIVDYPFEGEHWIEVTCQDYEAYTLLPHALEFQGRRYGRTGWNSDRCVAYYTTRRPFAIGLS